MPKVKLTITESKCRCGYFKKGQEFTYHCETYHNTFVGK